MLRDWIAHVARVVGLTVLFVAASPAAPVRDSADAAQLRSLNAAALRLQAGAEADPTGAVELSAAKTLAARTAVLRRLAAAEPSAAAALALPADVLAELRQTFPAANALLEQRGRWDGELEHVIEDDAAMRRHRSVYRLHRKGEVLELRFAERAPQRLKSGTRVRVGGVLSGGTLVAEDLEQLAAGVGPVGDALQGPDLLPASCATTGAQSVLSILVNLPSYSLPGAVSAEFMRGVLLGNAYSTVKSTPDWSLDDFWQQASDGRTWVDAANTTVVGPVTVASDFNRNGAGASFCDNYGLRDALLTQLDGQVDFRRYNRIQIVMPGNGACSWGGTATVGCRIMSTPGDGVFEASIAWQRADTMTSRASAVQLSSHEIGHNLGLLHAGSRDFGAEALGAPGASGSVSEYGDPFSTMGSWNFGFYASSQAANQLGWLAAGSNVQTVTTAGTYTVQNYEARPAGVKALKVRRGNATDQWLWLESRQNVGQYSSQLAAAVFGGALIHYEDVETGGYSHLLDFTPGTDTFTDAVLRAGETWSDPYSSLSLTVASVGPSGMTVQVNYGAPVCTRAAPTLTTTPAVVSSDYGKSVTLTLTLRSNDSAACAADTFSLGSTLPQGWTGGPAVASLTVSPGQQSQTTLTATIPNPYALGTYAVGASASGAAGRLATSASSSVTVTEPAPVCTAAAPSASLAPASLAIESGQSGQFTLTVRNNSSAACAAETIGLGAVAPAGWSKAFGNTSFNLAPGAQAQTTLTLGVPQGAVAGVQQVTVAANSAASNLSGSAAASVTVTEPAPVCTAAAPSVSLAPASLAIESGQSGQFTLTVRNNSSAACAAETIGLGAVAPAGWSKALGNTSFNLAPGAQAQTTLTLGVPQGAVAGVQQVTVAANSAASNLSGSAAASVTVTEPAPVCTAAAPTLTVTPAAVTAEAGGVVQLTVVVRNNSSAACSSEPIGLGAVAPAGWTRQFAGESFLLAPGQQAQTVLLVGVPAGTAAGSQPVTVAAQSASSQLSSSAAVAVTVQPAAANCTVGPPSLSVAPVTVTVDGGATTTLSLAVRNNSTATCAAETFEISAQAPAGWAASLASRSVQLAPGEQALTTLTLAVPSAAPAGSSVLNLAVRSVATALSGSGIAIVTVREVQPVCTAAAPGVTLTPAGLSVESGRSGQFTLTVTNRSSAACAAESIGLGAVLPGGWSRSFDTASFLLAPGQQAQARLTLEVPAGAPPGLQPVTVVATSAASSLSGSAGAGVTVAEPPPVCSNAAPSVTVSPSSLAIESGLSGQFTLTVHNNSSAACAAETIGLGAVAPAGWSKLLAHATLSLGPGQQAQTTLTIGVPQGTAAGAQAIQVAASSATSGLNGSSGTVVTVTEPAPVCVAAAPSVTMLPSSLAIEAGLSGQFTLTLRNNSSAACAAETIGLGAVVPAGWSRALGGTSFTLGPGQQAQTTLLIGVPQGAPSGVQSVTVATSGTTGELNAAASASVVVTQPAPVCTASAPGVSIAPSTVSAAAGATLQFAVTLRNNDSAACDARPLGLGAVVPAGWSRQFAAAAFQLAPGQQVETTLAVGIPSAAAAGVATVTVSASGTSASAAGSAVATVTVTQTPPPPPPPPPPVTPTARLSVALGTRGSGSVTLSAPGRSCSSDCVSDYALGDATLVTLSATPGPKSRFVGWSGACSGSASTCTVTMTADRSVTAVFQKITSRPVRRKAEAAAVSASTRR